MSDIPIHVIAGDRIIGEGNVIFDIKTSEPYHYKHGVFYTGEIARNRIMKLITDVLPRDCLKKYIINEAYEYIQIMTQKKIRPNENFICLENGALNIHHLNLVEHNRNYMLRHKIRARYSKNTDYTEWAEFVQGMCETPEAHDTLQEFIGYCFLPGQTAKKLLYIYGPPNSGKSTFYSIISWFFGKYNTSTLSLNDLTDRFLAQKLRFKLVNIRSDIQYKTTTTEVQKLKSLTGGDKQTFDKKFAPDPIEFSNNAKIMLSGNGVPIVAKAAIQDPAFCSRWIPIRFPYTFGKVEGVGRKWKSDEGKSQILNWALDGLNRLRENGFEFTYSPDEDAVREWLLNGQEMNDIDRFLLDNYMRDPTGYQIKSEMYDVYVSYCKRKGLTRRETFTFHRMVSNSVFFDIREYQPKIGDKQIRCWKGVNYHPLK